MLNRLRRFLQKPASLRPAGIFISHVSTPRITAHFERLRHETIGLIDWHFLHNDGNWPAPQWDIPTPSAEQLMPSRYRQMVANAGIMNGFLDTLVIPCVLALNRPFVWVMEYDVDFSGNWADFFRLYPNDPTDLLTTTVTTPATEPDWHHWTTARCPQGYPRDAWRRGFHPVMRMSRHFATTYCNAMRDDKWGGHWEYTLPSVAHHQRLSLRDLRFGGDENRVGPTYSNTPNDVRLLPGTFVWRPFRDAYFHEDPGAFAETNRLYHPIKTDDPGWDQAFNARRAAVAANT